MNVQRNISRRRFLHTTSLAAASSAVPHRLIALTAPSPLSSSPSSLEEVPYADVTLAAGLQESQLTETHAILMGLDDDALLKPFRLMAGRSAPGKDLGGWYRYDPGYNPNGGDAGFAPAHCFGQWVSALARGYSITGSKETRDRVLQLNQLLAESISGDYFDKTRFPAYSYDKLVLGLIDSQKFAADPAAFSILDKVTDIALPHLPGRAIERNVQWRPNTDFSYTWDESYTMAENLYLAAQRGAGSRYRDMAPRYLLDESFFNPLAENKTVFAGRHAYSTVNSLSSGMMAYLAGGSEQHLRAVKNAYEMLLVQSYVTGGWGPDEQLRAPDTDDVFASLTQTHNSFETPCGAYAHFKLTRYLLRATRESRYGDSMERVMYNTVLGAKPLGPNGEAFYYSDYNFSGKRIFSDHVWPCCAGTLPQVAADYRVNTYFRDRQDVYLNLYIPSTLRWTQDGQQHSLTQEGDYPFSETIRIDVKASQPSKFAINLRIPAWAHGASATVNGKALALAVQPEQFLRIERKWKNGDRIALTLPMELRTEAINAFHPETIALVRGPLVLFAIGEGKPSLASKQLLSARQVERTQWIVDSAAGPIKFAPFTAIGDQPYSTYLRT